MGDGTRASSSRSRPGGLRGAAGRPDEQSVNTQNLAVGRGRPLVTMRAGRAHAARISSSTGVSRTRESDPLT